MFIKPLDAPTIQAIVECDGGNGWKHDTDTWMDRLQKTKTGDQVTLVAFQSGLALGYGSLLWTSGYKPFAEAGIPEIHDVTTAKHHRRTGVATKIIGALEGMAAERKRSIVGIGVGLYSDYGAAQRLYASLGYVPDGLGVTSHGSRVNPGDQCMVDDHLILWMTKPSA